MIIASYDHASAGFQPALRRAVEALSADFPGVTYASYTLESDIEAILSAAVAIVHADSFWPILRDRLSPNAVVIRVFSWGASGKADPELSDRGAYLFTVIPAARSLEDADWVRILRSVLDEPERAELLKGAGPEDVRDFFVRPDDDLLCALSLLAQAYLAVCDARGAAIQAQIAPALVQMGWRKVGNDIGRPAGDLCFEPDILKAGFGSEADWSQVQDARWWMMPLVEMEEFDFARGADLIAHRLKREWADAPREVHALIAEFRRGVVGDPLIVKNAYCRIVHRLGGKPCQEV